MLQTFIISGVVIALSLVMGYVGWTLFDSGKAQKNAKKNNVKEGKYSTFEEEKVTDLQKETKLEVKKCTCKDCTCNKQENKATENVIEDIDREI